MAEPDYYKVLELERGATAEQIKRAYRKLAKRYHPDRNAGDKKAEAKFKQIGQAYAVLKDPEKRAVYDQYGRTDVGVGGPGGQAWSSGPGGVDPSIFGDIFGDGAGAGGMGDVFEQFFGRGATRTHGHRRSSRPRRGPDVEHEVSLTFDQAIRGTTLQVRTGQGQQRIDVKIPAGVTEGQRIRLRGKGQPGTHGGDPGDMHIVCRIQPHKYFERVGNDIYLTVPIGVTEAVLGARVELPTIDGRTTVTVPPGTASGTKLRLRGQGVVDRRTNVRGDQYVVVRIVPPKRLDEKQRDLVEKLAESLGKDSPRADLDW